MALPTTGPLSHSLIMGEFEQPAGTWKLSADGGPLINYPSGAPKVKESDFYGASNVIDTGNHPGLVAQGGWRAQYNGLTPIGGQRLNVDYPGNFKPGDLLLIFHSLRKGSSSTRHKLVPLDSNWQFGPNMASGCGSGQSEFQGYCNAWTFECKAACTNAPMQFQQDGGSNAHDDAWFHITPPATGISNTMFLQTPYQGQPNNYVGTFTPDQQPATGAIIQTTFTPHQASGNTSWNFPMQPTFFDKPRVGAASGVWSTKPRLTTGNGASDLYMYGGLSPDDVIADTDKMWTGAVKTRPPSNLNDTGPGNELYVGIMYVPTLAKAGAETSNDGKFGAVGNFNQVSQSAITTFPYCG